MKGKKQTVAEYIKQRIEGSDKSLDQIAQHIGVDSGKVIEAFMKGKIKVPIGKVDSLAFALGADPIAFLRRVLGEYTPELLEVLDGLAPEKLLTQAEDEVLGAYRALVEEAGGDCDVVIARLDHAVSVHHHRPNRTKG